MGLWGCVQHIIASHKAIPFWENITTIPGLLIGSDEAVAPQCKEPVGSANCNGLGEPPCGPYTDELIPTGCTVDQNASVIFVDGNCYKRKNNTVNLTGCFKAGYKNVLARKFWHGRFGFDNCDGADVLMEGDDCSCPYEEDRTNSNPRIRYLEKTVQLTIDIENVITTGGSTTESQLHHSVNKIYRTNRNSGWTENLGEKTGHSFIKVDGVLVQESFDLSDASGYGFGSPIANPNPLPGNPPARFDEAWDNLNALCLRSTGASSTVPGGGGYTIPAGSTSDVIDAFTIPSSTDDGITSVQNCEFSISATEISITIEWSVTGTNGAGDVHDRHGTISGTISLADVYSDTMVLDDLKDLLSKWDLRDDAQYPWRLDGNVSRCPMVCRAEQYGTPDAPQFAGDEPSYCYNGHIMGEPNPAGFDRHFQFCHTRLRWNDLLALFEQHCFGDLTPSYLPTNTTCWPNEDEADSFLHPGAFLYQSENVIYAQKWAETFVSWPSINWARPCGDDADVKDYPSDFDCESGDPETLDPFWTSPSAAETCEGEWNKTTSQHTYVVREWRFNNREAQENRRLRAQAESCGDCVELPNPDLIRGNQEANGLDPGIYYFSCSQGKYTRKSCRPAAIYITPNGDIPSGHNSHDFFPFTTDDFQLDVRYGARWHAFPVQSIPDPFFVNDPCNEFDEAEYVEARCSPPDGAPEMHPKAQVGFHCWSIDELNASVPPAVPGHVCPAPDGYSGPNLGADLPIFHYDFPI